MENIRELLITFSAKTKELESCGGPEKNGHLFEELLNLQDIILKKSGLPPLDKHCNFLWEFTDMEINDHTFPKIINLFRKRAADHLLSPVKTPLQMLAYAAKNNIQYGDIMPELGFLQHEYTIFVYNYFLLTGNATPEDVLKEFNTVKKHDLYELIYQIGNSGLANCDNSYKDLENKNLKFLEAYMLYKLYKSQGYVESYAEQITNDNCIEYHIVQAALKYLSYLNLCESGIDETEARHDAGLADSTFFIIAQKAAQIHFGRRKISFTEMKLFVFSKVKFTLSEKEFADIEAGFRLKWNSNSGEIAGDGDFKNAVYHYLESINQLIPQEKVDAVVDLILEYMGIIGGWVE